MKNPLPEHLEPIMARIAAWQDAREIEVVRIGGLTNCNYAVTVAGARFVLRVSGQNTEKLGINRAVELAALQAAAAAGIGPEVVAFLLPEGHLVTEWLAGRHWEAYEFRTSANVRRLTQVVKRIHQLPVNGAVFSPFRRVTAYLQTARELGVPEPAGLVSLIETMQAIAADQTSDLSDWQRFCHNDLVSVNYLFLEEEQSIRVLDWEFAGLGDIYYDLAAIVYTHDSDGPIPPELEAEMLEIYFGTVSVFQRRRLAGMKFMLMLFSAMWGLAQDGMQRAGWIPAAVGFDYHEFAEHLFAHDLRDLQNQYEQFAARKERG